MKLFICLLFIFHAASFSGTSPPDKSELNNFWASPEYQNLENRNSEISYTYYQHPLMSGSGERTQIHHPVIFHNPQGYHARISPLDPPTAISFPSTSYQGGADIYQPSSSPVRVMRVPAKKSCETAQKNPSYSVPATQYSQTPILECLVSYITAHEQGILLISDRIRELDGEVKSTASTAFDNFNKNIQPLKDKQKQLHKSLNESNQSIDELKKQFMTIQSNQIEMQNQIALLLAANANNKSETHGNNNVSDSPRKKVAVASATTAAATPQKEEHGGEQIKKEKREKEEESGFERLICHEDINFPLMLRRTDSTLVYQPPKSDKRNANNGRPNYEEVSSSDIGSPPKRRKSRYANDSHLFGL